MIKKNGLEAEPAENGAEALERLLDGDFDLIFMDNQMPVMNGFEATRRIRALPTEKGSIPIIGLTGRSDEVDRNAFSEDRTRCMDAGMNDYLVKPASPVHLRAVLARWLGPEAPKPSAKREPEPLAPQG